jgi:glycopeptide antibiotics resistance protein
MKIRFKPTYYWFTIFALTFIAYQLVQDNIRPNYNGDHLIVKYLLGIAPNFFPSIGIPALFVILIPELNKNPKTNEWLNNRKHITANIISLVGLLSWEFLQMTTTMGRFDWNDVLWTLIGAFIFQLIWMITPNQYKEEQEVIK